MIDFSRSYSSAWRLYKVNMSTWADSDIVDGLREASVTASMGEMIQSGNLTFDTGEDDDFEEGYRRLVMYATQDGLTERYDIATLYCMSASGTISKGVNARSATGVSVLYPANKRRIETGLNVAMGDDGVEFVTSLLSATIHAPVESYGTFTLADHFVFEVGSTVLSVVWDVLNAANYCMQISGNGTVIVRPMPTEPTVSLSKDGDGILLPEESYTIDWSSVPNRYVATDGASIGAATNDSPTSALSTVRRGFVVDPENGIDTAPMLINNESIDDYCYRRLHELSYAYDSREYTREYLPDVYPYSIVRRTTTKGVYDSRVESQSLSCGKGIMVTERARIEVNGWE